MAVAVKKLVHRGIVHLLRRLEAIEIRNAANATASDQPAQSLVSKDESHFYDKENKLTKIKIAILLAYDGKDYSSSNIIRKGCLRYRNPISMKEGKPTLEKDLLSSLFRAGYVCNEFQENIEKMYYQHAAQTETAMSALKQVVSVRVNSLGKGDVTATLNQHLPNYLRVLDVLQVPGAFDARYFSDERVFTYILPTYVFASPWQMTNKDFRITDEALDKIKSLLKIYVGSHPYHNFVNSKKIKSLRNKYFFMMIPRSVNYCDCDDLFIHQGVEFMSITIKVPGSILQNQLRKMIGLVIAISRGLAPESSLVECWESNKVVYTPAIPGRGMVLKEVSYYNHYNKWIPNKYSRFPEICWDRYQETIEDFKKKLYTSIAEEEIIEQRMLKWCSRLILDLYEPRIIDADIELKYMRSLMKIHNPSRYFLAEQRIKNTTLN